jgi:hypothetical protein
VTHAKPWWEILIVAMMIDITLYLQKHIVINGCPRGTLSAKILHY